MKLTEEQLSILRNTICEEITYRETYDEVYDHVLTALDNTDDNIPLGEAVNTIMLNDFGGFKGLRALEQQRRWMVGRQMINKQLGYLINHFKFPLLPVTLIIYAIIHYCLIKFQFSPVGMFVYTTTFFMLSLCGVYYHLKSGYKSTNIGKSIKYFPLKIISYVPFYIFIVSFFIINLTYSNIFKGHNIYDWLSLPPLIFSLLFTLFLIYIISFFKLYREECIGFL